MKDKPIDRTTDFSRAESAADKWIGSYTWAQQGGVSNILEINRILRSLWIHGYMAGHQDATASKSTVVLQPEGRGLMLADREDERA